MREHATHAPGLLARLLIGDVDRLSWPAELLCSAPASVPGYLPARPAGAMGPGVGLATRVDVAPGIPEASHPHRSRRHRP